MLSQEQAAKYLIVAWVKNWKMAMLVHVLCEDKITLEKTKQSEYLNKFERCAKEYQWFPKSVSQAGSDCRRFIGGHYPSLSEWLFNQNADKDRLSAFSEIMKLKCPDSPRWLRNQDEKNEMNRIRRSYRANVQEYHLARDSFKTHQRSAWNVCK